MPRKVQITKEDIVEAVLQMLREQGEITLNAREVAAALGSSTQPIYSNFATLEELEAAVFEGAYRRYFDFIRKEVEEGNYPQYKAFGMAYIRFAKEEPALFRLLFMKDNRGETPETKEDFMASIDMIVEANGISRENAELMHLEMWACVHGIATMLATSYIALDWTLISRMLSDVYQGLRSIRVLEGKEI